MEGGGGNGVQGVAVGPGDDAMMAYGGTTGNGGAMGPSSGGTDVLGSTGDYSPQGTPTSLTGHSTAPVEASTYAPGTGPTSYSPQDSPASSAGGGSGSNGQLPSFGFTQEQVACVCEVRLKVQLGFVCWISLFIQIFQLVRGVRVLYIVRRKGTRCFIFSSKNPNDNIKFYVLKFYFFQHFRYWQWLWSLV